MTLEERVSRLEGGYEHLATKADLFDLRADLKTDITRVESRLKAKLASLESRLLRWMIGMVLTSIVVASSVATLIQGFLD